MDYIIASYYLIYQTMKMERKRNKLEKVPMFLYNKQFIRES